MPLLSRPQLFKTQTKPPVCTAPPAKESHQGVLRSPLCQQTRFSCAGVCISLPFPRWFLTGNVSRILSTVVSSRPVCQVRGARAPAHPRPVVGLVQVVGVFPHLWRRSQVPGETLQQPQVRPQQEVGVCKALTFSGEPTCLALFLRAVFFSRVHSNQRGSGCCA